MIWTMPFHISKRLQAIPHFRISMWRILHLSHALCVRFRQGGSIQDLDRAIVVMDESAKLTTNERDRAGRLRNLGDLYQNRFEASTAINDLNEAISAYNDARKAIAHIDRSALLHELGTALQRRSEVTNCLDDLREAVEVKKECVDWLANGWYDLGMYSNDLSHTLQDLYDWTDCLDDLDDAILASREAVSLAYDNDDSASYLANLGVALRLKAIRTGSIEYFKEAVKATADALNSARLDHPSRAIFFSDYGDALEARFNRLAIPGDINRAVAAYEDALASGGGAGGCLRPCFLTSLSIALQARSSHEGSMADLDRAISVSAEAVRYTRGCVDRAFHLNTLAIAFLSRFDFRGGVNDLERALETAQAAIECVTEKSSTRAKYLKTLGSALLRKFERTMVRNDLDQAITTSTEAVTLTTGHPDYIENLTVLGTALQKRFASYGSIEDLRRVVKLRKEVVDGTPKDDPRISGHLANQGNALEALYWETGQVAYLNTAIEIMESAVRFTNEKHPERALCLHNLGRCLQSRHERMGSMDDLNNAILAKEESLKVVSTESPSRAMYLAGLAVSLQRRSSLTGSIDDIQNAVSANTAAVDDTPKKLIGRAPRLTNLGLSLRQRFLLTHSMDDLNAALSSFQEAVDCTSPSDTRRHRALSNLGLCFRDRFHKTGSLNDLDDAIRHFEGVVQIVPKGHPDRAACLINSAVTRQHRFNAVDSTEDKIMAIAEAEEAAEEAAAPTYVRIAAAIRAANLLETNSTNSERASRFFKIAVKLLPEVSPRSLTRRDQQRSIAEFSGIACRAAASVLYSQGDTVEALQLLEVGRGVLASLQLDTRTDVTDLELTHPALAREFKSLQDELDSELELDSNITEGTTLPVK